ncbi:MAG: hypothetical protein LUD27_08970 [Clostridia bacterium]|nr:hypothetical protein [Clostridia bacterium]
MEYSEGEYGKEVKRVKNKNYKIPIIIVIVVGVLLLALIIYVSSVTRKVEFEGETLTADNLSGYEQQMTDYFYLGSDNFTLYKDSAVTVKDGKIAKLKLELAIQSGTAKEYWRMENSSDGVTIKYKSSLDGDAATAYTLSDLSKYLSCLDDVINSDYTAEFSVTKYAEAAVSAESYLWNGDDFSKLSENVAADCYKIDATALDGTSYAFFVY